MRNEWKKYTSTYTSVKPATLKQYEQQSGVGVLSCVLITDNVSSSGRNSFMLKNAEFAKAKDHMHSQI